MRVKTIARATLAGIKRWLAEEPSQEEPTLPFDNHYDRICRVFRQIDQVCHREAYVWGVVQGLALAKAIGYPRVSVIEFGVAGGAGLLGVWFRYRNGPSKTEGLPRPPLYVGRRILCNGRR